MVPLTLILFGRFQANLGEKPLSSFRTSKVQALLVYLVAEPGSHLRESIMDLLWPDMPLDSARHNLRQILYYLRGTIPELGARDGLEQRQVPLLLSNRQTLELNPDAEVTADIDQFKRLIQRAQQHDHPQLSGCDACRQDLQDATAFYQGDFLADFFLADSSAFETWASRRRTAFQRQYLEAMQQLGQIYLAQGNYQAAEEAARKQIVVDALREKAQRQLLSTLALTGRRNEALANYDRLREHLWEALGVAPEAATRQLVEEIERGDLAASIEGGIDWGDELKGKQLWTMPDFLEEEAAQGEPPTPFVARQRELAQLQSALASAAGGHGQVMFVIGGAGRGKTALMQEFARRAGEADPNLVTVTGYCAAITGVGDPYLPFREALAMLTGDVEAKLGAGLITPDQARQLWQLMPETLPALLKHAPDLVNSFLSGPALQERAAQWAPHGGPLLLELAELTGTKQSSSVDQQRLFAEYANLLKMIAAERPLLMIIEDLHWVDTASSGLLFYLSREIGDSKILLVGTYRPEEITSRSAAGSGAANGEPHPLANILNEVKRQHGDIWIDLGQQDRDEGREFVDAYLDTQPNQLSADFRQTLFKRTGGHALFTVELLRAMQERGDLQRNEEGRWVEGATIDWTTLPHKVEGAIERRIETLGEELQSILAVASVEGEIFTAEVIARVQQINQRQLVQLLSRELDKRQRLVTAQTMDWLRPGRQRISLYRFQHQLFQHYLYHRLDEAERVYMHEAVGYVLEQLYEGQSEKIAGKLAHHFQMAGLIAKAIGYLQQAGEAAADIYAYEEAVTHYSRAVQLAEIGRISTEKLAYFYSRLGMLLMITKGDGTPEVGRAYHRAYELYQQVGESPQLFYVLRGLAMYHKLHGESERAQELTEQMAILADKLEDPEFIVESCYALGSLYYYTGKFTLAQKNLERGITYYDRQHHQSLDKEYNQDPGVSNLCYAALNLWFLGYPDRANKRLSEALDLARELAHPYSQALALAFACWVHLFRRDLHELRQYGEKTINLSRKHDFALLEAVGSLLQGWALVELAEEDRGIDQMCWSLSTKSFTEGEPASPHLLYILAEGYGKAGKVKEGLHTILKSKRLIDKKREFLFIEAEIYRLLGDLLLNRGSSEGEIEIYYQKAIEISKRQMARSFELRATMSLARLWHWRGKTDEGRQILGEIYGWFTEGLNTRDLQEAKALLQELS